MADKKTGKFELVVDEFRRLERDETGKITGVLTKFVKGDRLDLADDDAQRLLGAGAVREVKRGPTPDVPAPTPVPAGGNPEPIAEGIAVAGQTQPIAPSDGAPAVAQ